MSDKKRIETLEQELAEAREQVSTYRSAWLERRGTENQIRTAAERVVEAQATVDDKRPQFTRLDLEELWDAHNALAAALAGQQEADEPFCVHGTPRYMPCSDCQRAADEVCVWSYDETDEKWDTGCDHAWTFNVDGPCENGVRYCPYCGKLIRVEAEEEVDSAPIADLTVLLAQSLANHLISGGWITSDEAGNDPFFELTNDIIDGLNARHTPSADMLFKILRDLPQDGDA